MIPRGTIKLALTVEEHPRTSTVVTEFLSANCPSAFNGVIGRSLLKALRAVVSIHCLTMKFPTAMGTGQVQWRQCDSREYYNRSLELAEKERKLTRMMEVEKVNKGPMETNIDPRLQEEESTTGQLRNWLRFKWTPKS